MKKYDVLVVNHPEESADFVHLIQVEESVDGESRVVEDEMVFSPEEFDSLFKIDYRSYSVMSWDEFEDHVDKFYDY